MAKTKNQVEVVDKPKKVSTKTKVGTYSDFTNISVKASANTQTKSYKKLLKPILHSVGLTLGKSKPVSLWPISPFTGALVTPN